MQFIRTLLITGLVILSLLFPLYAQKVTVSPHQVKAAFLFNFTQFVEWPANAFPDADAPLIIGVVGEDPFGDYLDEVVRGEEVNGHPLLVQRFGPDDEINCHVLYINVEGKQKTAGIIQGIKGKSMLTVGDVPGFIYHGGMVRFITVDNKIKFRINLEAAKDFVRLGKQQPMI